MIDLVKLSDGWIPLSVIYSDESVESITHISAARSCDGIGEVASWSRGAGGTWKLDGWGCTEDHAGHDDDCDDEEGALPDAPPFEVSP